MRRNLIVTILLASVGFSPGLVSGQRTIDITNEDVNIGQSFFMVVGGHPVVTAKFLKIVEGTPYFKSEWMKGSVILSKGRKYENLILKLNLLENKLHFQDISGQEMVCSTPVREVILIDPVKGNQYKFVYSDYISEQISHKETGWYQSLNHGKVQLYKYFKKDISENQPYGSATIEHMVRTSIRYYLLAKNQLWRIKKLQEIPEILSDKKDQLVQYISSNKLNGKTDQDYIDIILYYNSLF